MLNAVSSNYKVNEVIKTSNKNNNENNNIESTQNNLPIEDKANFSNHKKASAPGSTSLFEDNQERVNPLASVLGFILAFVAMTGSSVAYNESLYNAFSADLDKCKRLFDKYGTSVEMDFLGNISAPKEKKVEEENK